ncbi:MAG TPA: hypothetical protein GX527_04425 [Clostridiaceae bacterium]|nr:hypothetical protein [Clostridiaceae bacterium]
MKKIIFALLVSAAIVFLLIGCDSQGNTPNEKIQTEEIQQEISAEERKRMDLYVAVMKAAFQEENGGKAFIAVKLDTMEGLSHEAKVEVLKELTDLSPNVYSFEDVKNDNTKFEPDDDGRLIRSIDGALLWVEVEEYSKSKSTITGVSWFGNLGAVFPKYEATFKNGKWQLELISMAIS